MIHIIRHMIVSLQLDQTGSFLIVFEHSGVAMLTFKAAPLDDITFRF